MTKVPGNKLYILLLFCLMLGIKPLKGQVLGFEVVQDADVGFLFNSIQNYQTGLVAMNAITLRITAEDVSWDFYVGAETDIPGLWDVVTVYAGSGDEPEVELLELRFRNTANTSLVDGFFELTDISDPTYIIGSAANDPEITCPNQGTNTPGSYLTQPECYQFRVDMRIVPGFNLRPGLYRIHVKYVLIENL